jgi:pilus assembly protein CpaC
MPTLSTQLKPSCRLAEPEPVPAGGFKRPIRLLLALLLLAGPSSTEVNVDVNCSSIVDRPVGIRRVSIANGDIAEAIATSATEVVVNGKAPGDTSLIIWDQTGNRSVLQVHVLPNSSKVELVKAQLAGEAGPGVVLTAQDGLYFLNGTARDLITAERALQIASSLGKVVNLLRVTTPLGEPQILLKVRFADIDRTISDQFAVNLVGLSPTKGQGGSSSGQFGNQPTLTGAGTSAVQATFSSLLNIFYFRPDINIGAILEDLVSKNVLQMLAEPNLLTVSGKAASFLAGGEFPFPTLQGGGAGVGQVTIQFRDFGIKLRFTPTITPRGTIRLEVSPEVSSLDYANGLSVSGFTVPGLTTRRVDTEVELKSGQSFVIAGLLNNQVTQQLSRMPGLANIPLLGRIFQSHNNSKSNTELMVLVTPELVNPIGAGQKAPEVAMDVPFLGGTAKTAPRQPATPESEQNPLTYRRESLAVEELKADKPPASSPAPNASQAPRMDSNGGSFLPTPPPNQSGTSATPPQK